MQKHPRLRRIFHAPCQPAGPAARMEYARLAYVLKIFNLVKQAAKA
jgi:hypothetical protein